MLDTGSLQLEDPPFRIRACSDNDSLVLSHPTVNDSCLLAISVLSSFQCPYFLCLIARVLDGIQLYL